VPIVESLMKSLVERYGKRRGEDIYYAMEAEGKGPFAPGAKHRDMHEAFAAKHGLEPQGKKKPRSAAKRKRG
jgi:hypothetical protein